MKPSAKRVQEQELVASILAPHHVALHVGPWAYGKDPVPLFVATRLDESRGGKLIFLDAQGQGSPESTRKLPPELLKPDYSPTNPEALRRHATGSGHAGGYAKILRKLNKEGKYGPLAEPYEHYESALDTGLKEEVVDRIVDRGSSEYAISAMLNLNRTREEKDRISGENIIQKLAKEYCRVLKPGGKILMLFPDLDNSNKTLQAFAKAFGNLGLTKEIHSVIPTTETPFVIRNKLKERDEKFPGEFGYPRALLLSKPGSKR